MHPNSLRVILDTLGPAKAEAERRLMIPLRFQLVEYLVRFLDGGHERYQITYTAGIEAETLADRWRYRGHCWRQVGLVNRAGERFEKSGLDRSIELSPGIGGKSEQDWSVWRECPYQGSPPSAEREFKDVSTLLMRRFEPLVIADKRSMENYFRHAYPGTEAVSETG